MIERINTLLVPNTGNFVQSVEYVTTAVESNCRDVRRAIRERKLTLLHQLV